MVVVIAAATVVSLLATVRDFAVDSLGLGGVFLPTLLSLLVGAGCVFTIASRTIVPPPPGFREAAPLRRRYRYGVWTRRFAKAALAALLFVIPTNLMVALEQTVPLPTHIVGVLIDTTSKAPVDGARVRLVQPDGVDVTGAHDPTSDSRGVFIATATRRIRRNATAVIYRDGCKPTTVGLWTRFETPVPDDLPYVDATTSPFFTFHLQCQ
jgi:hypothetical protein